MPVFGNIDAARDPYMVMLLHIIEEARQCRRTRRPPHQTAVQADGQHLGLVQTGRIAFLVQRIERVF